MEEHEESTRQHSQPSRPKVFPSILFVGTQLLLCLSAALLLYAIAVLLGMVSLLTESYIQIKNPENVVYSYTPGGNSSQTLILLIPEYSIDVGMLFFSLGPSYFSRRKWNLIPLQPLLNASQTVDPLLPEPVRNAYVKVRNDALRLGFAAAESCGGASADKIMGKSEFVVKGMIIAIICSAGVVVVGAYFSVTLSKAITWFAGRVTTCWGRKEVELCGNEKEYIYTIRDLREQMRKERILIIVLTVCGAMGAFFFVMTLVAMHSVISSLKCGRSFCKTYEVTMQQLFELLPSGEYSTWCHVGPSSGTLLAGTIMALIGFVLLLLILGVHITISCSTFTLLEPSPGGGEFLEESTVRNPMMSIPHSPEDFSVKTAFIVPQDCTESLPPHIQLLGNTDAPPGRECGGMVPQCALEEPQETLDLERKSPVIQPERQDAVTGV